MSSKKNAPVDLIALRTTIMNVYVKTAQELTQSLNDPGSELNACVDALSVSDPNLAEAIIQNVQDGIRFAQYMCKELGPKTLN
jgi:hypothetical protein